jgi:23S rRNA (cytidine1920-2'-O)/16S rRNA (cytidine1409-2'-O)-methyltransferase
MSRRRLDAELVRRGLARSRDVAAQMICDGQVSVHGQVASKAATQVEASAPIVVRDRGAQRYVSRGAHKLLGALSTFTPDGLVVADRRCLDAGASTGGFTQVLLRRGARQVVAVDVGYGQLAWSLRSDARVVVVDRTNVRTLTTDQIGGPVELIVADLSFISLTLVLPALAAVLTPTSTGDLVVMVKPQFEVGREALGSGGVVREPSQRSAAVRKIASAADALGLGVAGVAASPLPGPAGNVEYFLWLRAGAAPLDPAALQRAVEEGPQ